jgi:D-alanyl-D-alanine carboxypeptidase
MLAAVLSIVATPARAQIGSARYAAIVVDANTGQVLSATNPDAPRIPASLTKMMTLYMTFEALRDRRITLNELVPVSEHCANMQPVKLGLIPGVTRLTVRQAILGMVTLSANDAACAMGEMLAGGSEARFAQMMTLRARGLGMTHTIYRNASGLPTPQNITTVRDIATLARHLIYDFPGYYHYFSVRNFVFHGRTVFGHDDLLATYPGVDGLKTGFTDLSGFNLCTSAVRGGVRLIGVVVGFRNPWHRDADMRHLLNVGFREVGVLPGSNPGLHLVTQAVAATMPHPVLPHPAIARPVVAHPVVAQAPAAAQANYLVNVGAYGSWPAAQHAAILAHSVLGAGAIRVVPAGTPAHRLWGAQLTGFSYGSAEGACRTLAQHRLPCEPART